jgi:hypothetical protein
MAGLQDLIRRFDAGGSTATYIPPTNTTDPMAGNAAFLQQYKSATNPADRNAIQGAYSDWQTNQNLGNLYGVTSAPAQTQFLSDFNKAAATPGFQYVSSTPGAVTASQAFEQALASNKGNANALMNQFTTGQGAADNPFLGLHPAPVAPYVPPLQEGQTTPIGSVFDSTKYPNIQSTGVGPDGYIHVVTTTGEYLLNPNSQRVVFFTPKGYNGAAGDVLSPYGQGPNPYQGPNLAKGGSIQMPQEYSQGNWKLI